MKSAQMEYLPTTSTAAEPSETAELTRVYYFDYLRMWATCAVVLLHTSALVFGRWQKPSVDFVSRFTVADFGDAAGRFGVGCFFMVSGALLLSPDRTFRLGKHLRRVGIPLVTWSGIYLLFRMYLEHEHLPRFGPKLPHLDVKTLGKLFVKEPYAYHLWFLYALIGIYLIIPLLRPLTALPEPRRGQLLRYGLLLWLVFAIVIPTAQFLWPGHLTVHSSLYPSVPLGYVGTVLLGFYLHHHGVRIRNTKALVAIAMLSLVTGAMLLFELLTHGRQAGWALGNLTPYIALYTAAVFLVAKNAFNRPGRAYPFVALFSNLSFRIYLVHALVLHSLVVETGLLDWHQRWPLFSIPLITGLTIAISFGIAWLIEQIKPIRNYV